AAVNSETGFTYELEGTQVDPKARPYTNAVVTGDGYFEVLRVAPLRGRVLAAADHSGGLPAAVVNRAFAAKAWPGEDPVGKRVRIFVGNTAQDWMTVAGMIPDILPNSQRVEADPTIYLPFRLAPRQGMGVMARTAGAPTSLAPAFRREVQAI